jgi:hypothetical protein
MWIWIWITSKASIILIAQCFALHIYDHCHITWKEYEVMAQDLWLFSIRSKVGKWKQGSSKQWSYISKHTRYEGHAEAQLVEALCYKLEGHEFNSQWGHWFLIWPNPSSSTRALGSLQPLTEMSTRNLPGCKEGLAHKADNLTAICGPTV